MGRSTQLQRVIGSLLLKSLVPQRGYHLSLPCRGLCPSASYQDAECCLATTNALQRTPRLCAFCTFGRSNMGHAGAAHASAAAPRLPRGSVRFSASLDEGSGSPLAPSSSSMFSPLAGQAREPSAIASAAREAAAAFGGALPGAPGGDYEGAGFAGEGGRPSHMRRRVSNLSDDVRRGSRRMSTIAGNLLSRLQVRSGLSDS